MTIQKHLIALDLDGTLLTDQKTITDQTKQILVKARKDGHIVVIATGRPHRASITYYNELQMDTPMVNFNGAIVHHPNNKKWVPHHTTMPKQTALSVIETCLDLDVYNMAAEIEDSIFLDKYDKDIIDLFESIGQSYPSKIGNLITGLKTDPTALLIHPKDDQIEQLRSHLNTEHAEVIEHRKWDAPWNLIEVIRKGLNKAAGLQKIAQYYDIPKERIIAFGDGDNDLEMIDYAGIGVAMGNAVEPLKSIAKYMTDTNEQEGVGTFLESYLKLEGQAKI